MSRCNVIQSKQVLMGKLEHGKDVLEELTSVCVENGVRLGRVEAIGAVKKANVGFYNQQEKKYYFHEIDKPLEITSLTGNISIRDDKPIIHAHITFSDDQGRAFGGHLAAGTIVFACEFVVHVFDGPEYCRGYDEQTGLPLWEM